LSVSVNGLPLPPARIAALSFELAFPLPQELVGKESIDVSLAVDRTVRPDGRELGLAFGVFEVR
jgi:hypothetical protein